MAIIRATAILEHLGGKPEDAARNVWHFATAGAQNDTVLTKIGQSVADFYITFGARLGFQLSRAGGVSRVELATVTQGGPGAVDDTVTTVQGTVPFTLPAAAGGNFPSEMAIAMSVMGDVEGIPEELQGGLVRPRSSRRGRIFVGPLTAANLSFDAGAARVIVSPEARTAILTAYDTARANWIVGPNNARHVIYSRKLGQVFEVRKRWVDDAFDVVQSRGEDSLARSGDDVVLASTVLS
jgi:hypothetical protein